MKVVIVGAGSTGRVMYDKLIEDGYIIAGFIDDNKICNPIGVKDLPIFRSDMADEFIKEDLLFLMAIYNGNDRKRVALKISDKGGDFFSYRGNNCFVSPSAMINDGSCLLSHSYVMNSATIGNCCHLHFFSSVGHDTIIGNYSTIMGHCSIGGGCQIGECVSFGMGSIVVPGKKIGDNSIIGAGALVTNHVPPNSIVFGAPGKIVRNRR